MVGLCSEVFKVSDGQRQSEIVCRTDTDLWWRIVEERVDGPLCIPVGSFEDQASLELVAARDGRDLLCQRGSVGHCADAQLVRLRWRWCCHRRRGTGVAR